jgi:hypothetical protein
MKNEFIRKTWIQFIEKYKQYFLSNEEEWVNNLELIRKYIDKNNKRPSRNDKNSDIKKLGKWISHQQENYKKNIEIMKNQIIKKYWEEFIEKYKQYFLSNNEIWLNTLKLLKEYIDENGKRPSTTDKDIDLKRLCTWISHQQKNYKKNIEIMKNQIIKKYWEEFIEKYKQYFISNEEEWVNNLELIRKYIDKNNKIPSYSDKNSDIKKLGSWIRYQKQNYLKNKDSMKKKSIKKQWEDFINNPQYKQYFISNEEEWVNNLEILKNYIDKNNKKPSRSDKDIEIKQLGRWIDTQQQNYKKNIEIMKNQIIKKYWEEFINKSQYKKYFD